MPVLSQLLHAGRSDQQAATERHRAATQRAARGSTRLPFDPAIAQLEPSTRRSRRQSELAPRTLALTRHPVKDSEPWRWRTRPAQLRCPHPLPTPARPAQPSEPILFPKLRIWLADFPYLHCSIDQRLFTLETCCGYGYGLAQKSYHSLGFSRDGKSAPDTARAAVLYGNNIPISGQADSRASVPYKEKKTLPGTPAVILRVRLRYRYRPQPPDKSG